MPLTDVFIRSLKPLEKPYRHFDGGGLYIHVAPTGSKLWRMSYRFVGKGKLLSFGEYPTVSLKDAREKREEAKKLWHRGLSHLSGRSRRRPQGLSPCATPPRISL